MYIMYSILCTCILPYSPKFSHSDDIHLNTKFIACENLGLYGIKYSVLCTCTVMYIM